MGHAVHISRPKDKTPTKLERIFPQFVLAMAPGFGTLSGKRIVLAEEMEERSFLKTQSAIGLPLLVNQKWKGDSGFFTKRASVEGIAQANGGKPRSFVFEFLLVFAQLRDMLAAEDSTIVAKKHHDRRPVRPQRSELHWLSIRIREGYAGELAAEGIVHGHILS